MYELGQITGLQFLADLPTAETFSFSRKFGQEQLWCISYSVLIKDQFDIDTLQWYNQPLSKSIEGHFRSESVFNRRTFFLSVLVPKCVEVTQ